jgi:hypothetical protein
MAKAKRSRQTGKKKEFELLKLREVRLILPRPLRKGSPHALPRPRSIPATPKHMLTTAQYAALGRVVVETTYLEHYLHYVVPIIAGMQWDAGGPFVQGRSVMQMLQLLQGIALPKLKGKQAEGLSKLIDQLKKAVEERNWVVHGMWTNAPRATPERMLSAAEAGPARAFKRKGNEPPYSAANILKIAQRLEQLQYELWDFIATKWTRVKYIG